MVRRDSVSTSLDIGESWGFYIPVGHSFLKVHSSANTTRVDDLELEG